MPLASWAWNAQRCTIEQQHTTLVQHVANEIATSCSMVRLTCRYVSVARALKKGATTESTMQPCGSTS